MKPPKLRRVADLRREVLDMLTRLDLEAEIQTTARGLRVTVWDDVSGCCWTRPVHLAAGVRPSSADELEAVLAADFQHFRTNPPHKSAQALAEAAAELRPDPFTDAIGELVAGGRPA